MPGCDLLEDPVGLPEGGDVVPAHGIKDVFGEGVVVGVGVDDVDDLPNHIGLARDAVGYDRQRNSPGQVGV